MLAGQRVGAQISFIARLVRSVIFYGFPAWIILAAYVGFAFLVGLTVILVRPRRGFPCCPPFPLAYMPSPLPRWVLRVSSLNRYQRRRPSPFLSRVGSHVTRFEACSAFTHVTACMLADPPRGHLLKCFSPVRYLLEPLQVLPAGATVAGRDSHPLETTRLPRRTEKSGIALPRDVSMTFKTD
jgi:hypothetical protein